MTATLASHPAIMTFESASDAHFLRFPTPLQSEAHKRAKERHARLGAMVVLANAGRAVLALPKPVAEPAEPPKPIPLVIEPLSAQFAAAHEMLERAGVEGRSPVGMIQRIVAARYGVTTRDLVCASRLAVVTRPRMIAIYLSRTMTGKSFPELGRRFCRDHSSIRHAMRVMAARVAADAEFASEVEGLRAQIGGAP